jgi:hypothetical protein
VASHCRLTLIRSVDAETNGGFPQSASLSNLWWRQTSSRRANVAVFGILLSFSVSRCLSGFDVVNRPWQLGMVQRGMLWWGML